MTAFVREYRADGHTSLDASHVLVQEDAIGIECRTHGLKDARQVSVLSVICLLVLLNCLECGLGFGKGSEELCAVCRVWRLDRHCRSGYFNFCSHVVSFGRSSTNALFDGF